MVVDDVLPLSEDGAEMVELLPPEYSRSVMLVDFRVAAIPKALGSEFLKLLQAKSVLGSEFLHLKRVRTAPPPAPLGLLEVLVCIGDSEPEADVAEFLSARGCDPCHLAAVPRHEALTRNQLSDFSVYWPLTYRKPSLQPLELSAAARAAYNQLLRRAVEVGNGKCGCVIVDRAGRELAAAGDATSSECPLRHAVMEAIDAVAAARRAAAEKAHSGSKRPRSEEDYLCQDFEVVTTHEPCVMCAMALVHSRVRLIAFRTLDPEFGGLGGKVSLHTCQSLNHQVRVIRWVGA